MNEHTAVLVRRFYRDLWNRFDKTVFPEILTADFRFRGSLGRETVGWDEFGAYVDEIRAFAPDFHNHIERLVASDVAVFAKLRYTGTHQGPALGFEPTGRPFAYHGAALFDVEEELIREAWVLGDVDGLKRQLAGAGPAGPAER